MSIHCYCKNSIMFHFRSISPPSFCTPDINKSTSVFTAKIKPPPPRVFSPQLGIVQPLLQTTTSSATRILLPALSDPLYRPAAAHPVDVSHRTSCNELATAGSNRNATTAKLFLLKQCPSWRQPLLTTIAFSKKMPPLLLRLPPLLLLPLLSNLLPPRQL